MYTEERRSSGLVKRLLLSILFIIILIVILVWFFPTKNSLKPLYEGIFRDNLNSMREAAETYFTNERLPKEVGDKVRLTLQEMLDMHLLLPFVDKNGQMCDLTASYVEIVKTETEYEMTVNLVCPEEEAYIIEHMGCYDKCESECPECPVWPSNPSTPCDPSDPSVPSDPSDPDKPTDPDEPTDPGRQTITYYEFKRGRTEQVFSHYECKSGYTLGEDNICYKTKVTTDTKAAKPVVETKTEYVDADVKPISNVTYKYLYRREKQYSAWSDWSSNKEYDPNNNNITWGQQELVWNEKNGGKKVTTRTPIYDKTDPQYKEEVTVIGYYTQYLCSGYNYYKSQSTNKIYKTSGWVLQPEQIVTKEILDDTETTRYVRTSVKWDSCVNCTSDVYYVYKVYKQSIEEVTDSSSDLGASCKVEEKRIPILGTKLVFAGYPVVYDIKTEMVYYYHTKTRTVTSEAQEKWSKDPNDQSLLNQGYKYVRKEIDTEKTDVEYSCPSGYSNFDSKTKKCSKQVQVTTGYTCPTGYTYNEANKNCTKTTTETTYDDAIAKYKDRIYEEYRWATTPTLDGWTATGRKKVVVI